MMPSLVLTFIFLLFPEGLWLLRQPMFLQSVGLLNGIVLLIFLLACRERVRQRLALYQGVCPIYLQFTDDAEKTFTEALSYLQVTSAWFIHLHSQFQCFNIILYINTYYRNLLGYRCILQESTLFIDAYYRNLRLSFFRELIFY